MARGYNVPEVKKGAIIAVVTHSPIGRILMRSIERLIVLGPGITVMCNYNSAPSLSLTTSTYGELGPDVQGCKKDLVTRQAKNSSELHSREAWHLAKRAGEKKAHLRQQFPFALKQALSFGTRDRFCG